MKFIQLTKLFYFVLPLIVLTPHLSIGQLGNNMYGLYRQLNPTSVTFVEMDPVNGIITPIGSTVLSTTINTTGVALNPYNLSYSYQDDDSWLSISLQNGSILSDVTVNFPSATGDFNNFRFNTSDSIMYGLYSQVVYNQATGTYTGDMRLGSCDLTTGLVSLISPTSIATSYTMAGAVINPHLMVYYFITEDKLRGLDIYNGTIYSDPLITIPSGGNSFDNFAYNCADTSMYGLIMQNGVKCLGKIDATTGVVTALPTLLNLPNYILNAASIDPINGIYYFESMLTNGVTLMGLSLVDGSIVSSIEIPNGAYFDMFRIDSDCYESFPTRFNPAAQLQANFTPTFELSPNPTSDYLRLSTKGQIDEVRIYNALGEEFTFELSDTNPKQINLENLKPGVYLIEVLVGNSKSSQRFVKI
ncbi:MAG: T9SS type A sorting domain-containing protein [Flavobacteriales bacterium]